MKDAKRREWHAWHAWDEEYPDDGSIIVLARSAEEAIDKARSEFGRDAEVGVQECMDDCPCEED